MLDGNNLTNSTLEILSLLAVAFLLGYLLKLFMGNKWKALHEDLESENMQLTNDLAASNSKIKSLEDNANYLRTQVENAKRAASTGQKSAAKLGVVSGRSDNASSGTSKPSIAASSSGTATVARSTPAIRPVTKSSEAGTNGTASSLASKGSTSTQESVNAKTRSSKSSAPKKSSSASTKKTASSRSSSMTKAKSSESAAKKTSTSGAKKGGRKKKDDLTKIEGVGPKIQEIFNKAGIRSFEDLGGNTPTKLRKILQEAGPRYKMHDPKTWPRQAKYAASGNWKKLQDYQDSLKGGRTG
ncbi:MAG: hypothetical protein HKN39_04160 [Flavobacteriales bacterium]|nr:hypothetical protein [Flavobacteriales bacterium]